MKVQLLKLFLIIHLLRELLLEEAISITSLFPNILNSKTMSLWIELNHFHVQAFQSTTPLTKLIPSHFTQLTHY